MLLTPTLTTGKEPQPVILLEPSLLGITGTPTAPPLGRYFNEIFRLGIGVAIGLGVLVFMVRAFQEMGSESVFGKTSGSEGAWSALGGVLFALMIFPILFTINPHLVQFDLLQTINDIKRELRENPGSSPETSIPSCQNCSPLSENIPIKAGACNGECQLESGFASRLEPFNRRLKEAGIQWRVTEGYPPTRVHRNQCHQAGTCIDANFTGASGPSAYNITEVINAARDASMTACYELGEGSSNVRNRLITQGVPPEHIKIIPNLPNGNPGISAPHFSIYGYQTGC